MLTVTLEDPQTKETIWETKGELVYSQGRRETSDIISPSLNGELQIPWCCKPSPAQKLKLIPGIICRVDGKEFNVEAVVVIVSIMVSIRYIFRLNGGKPCVPRTSGSR